MTEVFAEVALARIPEKSPGGNPNRTSRVISVGATDELSKMVSKGIPEESPVGI